MCEIIIDKSIKLRSLSLRDAVDIFNTIDTQREYLQKWLPFVAYTKSVNDSEEFVRYSLKTEQIKGDRVFTVRFQNEFAGLIGFKGTDLMNKKSEIGYWLSEHMQHQGIMTNSVKGLCNYGFREMELNRIQIKCAIENTPSKKIPARLKFLYEGIERDGELMYNGKYTDIEIYSILKREWKNG